MIPRVHILQKPGGREGRIRRNYQQTLQMPSLMAPGCSRLSKNIVQSPNNWGKYKKDMRWVTTESEDSREGGRRGWGVAPIWYWEPRRSREIELHCSWFAGITPSQSDKTHFSFPQKSRATESDRSLFSQLFTTSSQNFADDTPKVKLACQAMF